MVCREYHRILILSMLPAASYMYPKPPYRKMLEASSLSFLSLFPTPVEC